MGERKSPVSQCLLAWKHSPGYLITFFDLGVLWVCLWLLCELAVPAKCISWVGTLIHFSREVCPRCALKSAEMLYLQRLHSKRKKRGKNTVLIVSCLLIQEIFYFAYFLLVQVFLGLVPIYFESERTRHLCFQGPGKATVPLWVNQAGFCAFWPDLGSHSVLLLFLPLPLAALPLFRQRACHLPQQRGLREFPNSQGRGLKLLTLETTKCMQT